MMDGGENFDVRKADRAALCDIRNVVIDTTLPCKERIKSYIDQIGNPYCYVDDGVVVAIGYADTQVSLQDRLKSYVSSWDKGQESDGNSSDLLTKNRISVIIALSMKNGGNRQIG